MMDEMTSLHENPGNIWQDHYVTAAYASQAVVHLMSKEGFSSAEVRGLFQARGGFMSRLHRSKEGSSGEDSRLLGAVLSKLALRGNPAPCSLKVEHYVLQKAQDAGLLVFEKSFDNGKIKFSCTPLMKDFDLMLRICCLPELLVDDSEVDHLLHDYKTLLEDSGPATRFFEKLTSILPDKRLALFVVPVRILGQDFGEIMKSKGQVDFVIQIPNLKRKTHLKIAIELGESLNRSDTKDGWVVKRFGQMKKQYWESEVRKLADQISYTLTDDVLKAAKQLRELPLEKKTAIQELISLPIAEAQLTQAIAGLIYRGEKAEIAIGNPQKLDLAVVVEAVREMIGALSSLYGIPSAIELRLADDSLVQDLEYFSLPTGTVFSCASIVPWPLSAFRGSIQPDAIPRPISRGNLSANVRNSLRFILNNIFRIQDFMEDQAGLIEQMLSLQGSIGLLKPGGGKTLAYQMASILQPGITLVVVPTRYSAADQEYNLAAMGIHRSEAIFETNEEWVHGPQNSMELHEAAIYFLAADTLHDRGCRARLEHIFSNRMNFLVFDEVHAMSEWSHRFQPGYLNLVRWVKDRCVIRGSKPSLIALTSFNSRLMLLDIMNELGQKDLDCIVESASHDRKNLQYEIHKVNTKNRMQVLIAALRATLREYGWKGENPKIPCGLIICSHEDDEDIGLTSLSNSLGPYLNIPLGVCSLKPPTKFLSLGGSREDWRRASCKAMLQFKRSELPILVCSADTAAELDKEDIRFTLHAGMPASLDEFYRQSGQAGHDGMQSSCMIFFSDDDKSSGHEAVSNIMDDGVKNGKPLAHEFPGRKMEKRILSLVILKLLLSAPSHNIGDKVDPEIFISSLPNRFFLINNDFKVSPEWKQNLLEKALYRLLLIGAIDGYEKRPESFKVSIIIAEASYIYLHYKKYINRYENECMAYLYLPKENASSYKNAVLQCGCRLIDYSHHRIKTKKADDIAKMFQAAEVGQASHLREFTEQSWVPTRLAAIASESWWRVLEEVKGLDDLLGLLLACRRKLRLQSDDPVLRMIAGFCALAFSDTGQDQSDLMKGFCNLKNSTSTAYRADVARQIIFYADLLIPSQRDFILESIWKADPSLEISRLCYERSGFSSEICYSSLFKLVNGLSQAFKVEGVWQ